MLKIKPYVNKVAEYVSYVSFVCFIAIGLLTVIDVIGQRVFNHPILGAYELVERLMLCAVFCAFAYGQTQKSHINMTLVIDKLPRVPQMIIFSVMSVISVGMAAVLTYAAGVQVGVAHRAGTVTGMLHIPLWPFYIVECAAMAIFSAVLLYDAALAIGAIFSEELAEDVRSSWT